MTMTHDDGDDVIMIMSRIVTLMIIDHDCFAMMICVAFTGHDRTLSNTNQKGRSKEEPRGIEPATIPLYNEHCVASLGRFTRIECQSPQKMLMC